MRERALNGVEVPIVAKGEVIGHRTVYNDRLLMFLLRQRDPLRYAPEMANPHMTWYRPPPDFCDEAAKALDAIIGDAKNASHV